MSLPTENDVDKALNALAESDQLFAQRTAELTAAKEGLKISKAQAMPRKGTSQERENEALTSPQYSEALDKLKKAEYHKVLLGLRREGWQLTIDCWRTLEASRRRS